MYNFQARFDEADREIAANDVEMGLRIFRSAEDHGPTEETLIKAKNQLSQTLMENGHTDKSQDFDDDLNQWLETVETNGADLYLIEEIEKSLKDRIQLEITARHRRSMLTSTNPPPAYDIRSVPSRSIIAHPVQVKPSQRSSPSSIIGQIQDTNYKRNQPAVGNVHQTLPSSESRQLPAIPRHIPVKTKSMPEHDPELELAKTRE
jgi:hypothetical protein